MADLDKHHDREDWLTWAIEFMRRGLWLGEEVTVHGPHDPSNVMWGVAGGQPDGTQRGVDCSFVAVANRSKYRPVRIRIRNANDKDEQFPVLRVSELTPKAQRWLLTARQTLRKLRAE